MVHEKIFPVGTDRLVKIIVRGYYSQTHTRIEPFVKVLVKKGRGVSRMYGKVIETAEKRNLKPFMMDNIHPKTHIRTDGSPDTED